MNEEPQYRSIQSVADQLGVDHSCVRFWIRQGMLATIKIGRRILIPVTEVTRLIAEAQKGSDKPEAV